MCVLVTPWAATSRRNVSASKRSSITTVCPSCRKPTAWLPGAEWYSGEQTRCTPAPGRAPYSRSSPWARVSAFSGGTPGSGRRTPLGRPVVPDVYAITWPAVRSSGSAAGCPAPSSARAASRPTVPPTVNRCRGRASTGSARATSAPATRTAAPLSPTTKATSGGARCRLTGTKYIPIWPVASTSSTYSGPFGTAAATTSPVRSPSERRWCEIAFTRAARVLKDSTAALAETTAGRSGCRRATSRRPVGSAVKGASEIRRAAAAFACIIALIGEMQRRCCRGRTGGPA